ncbi:Hypothetical predicted protein [Octopus vulgaris]|uniref:Uncharacterized protein n=1 Tax=Octopus vulgaris TaxID=6645 RepID=A0AA36FR80_OCTVU|nr:Hypothetical predicted protein [Octopus vulgaris]
MRTYGYPRRCLGVSCAHITGTSSVGSKSGGLIVAGAAIIITRHGFSDIAVAVAVVVATPGHGATFTTSDVGAVISNIGHGASGLAGTVVVSMVILSVCSAGAGVIGTGACAGVIGRFSGTPIQRSRSNGGGLHSLAKYNE